MSSVALSGNASGTGVLTIQSPNTNSSYTATLPAATTTLVGTDATQTLTNKTLSGATWTSPSSSTITSGTAQNSTSGTSIDFTSIPSWVKRITVMFNGVSLSGTSDILVQLGTSGGIVSTGYISSSFAVSTAPASVISNSTAGFEVRMASATSAFYGIVVVASIATNQFVSSHSGRQTATSAMFGGGSVSLGGTLTTLRITTANGTDTFAAGTINILYE